MTKNSKLVCALGCALMLVVGCSSQPEPTAQPAPTTPTVSPETEPAATEPAPVVPAEPPTAAPVEEPPVETEPPPPAVEPTPAPEAVEPVAPAEPDGWAVVDLGGQVEVGATRAGLTRIGAGKCKICHKVQYASWAENGHGIRTPPLDCEDCHGPGSAYKGKKVMEDPEQARAAGMVIPDRAFCEQCHKGGWTDDLMTRTHAHKEEGS